MNEYEKMCWNELVSECLEGTSPLITSCEDSILSANERIKELEERLITVRVDTIKNIQMSILPLNNYNDAFKEINKYQEREFKKLIQVRIK